MSVEPGWSLALTYYHVSADAGGSKEFPKGDNLTLSLDLSEDLLIPMLTYVFEAPVGGGRARLESATDWGNVGVDVDAILTGSGSGVQSGSESDSNTAFGDLFPTASASSIDLKAGMAGLPGRLRFKSKPKTDNL